ncbi:MAG TPA: DUF2017 domain-containing protein [Trebonia sp.]|nr:DUF2017 domain-containing protein [Trebonia sp.]
MEMFRPTRDGGASVRLSAGEATLLRTLVVPVMELLSERDGGRVVADARRDEDEPSRVLDDLEQIFEADTPETPEDPVLARLLPDAYQDDPAAAGEFRKYTESSLREAKKYFAQTLLDTLPPNGGRVKLTGDQARDWLRALNDVRLMFGVRLEVTEDFEDQLAALSPEDPKIAAFEVYGWLGAVQESLVQALAR